MRIHVRANQIGFEELDGVLHGTTAMAVSVDDPTAPARLLAEFAKSHDKYFNIKAGFLEGKVVDVATVESLAAIPPKDILLSTVLGTMMAPVAALAADNTSHCIINQCIEILDTEFCKLITGTLFLFLQLLAAKSATKAIVT